jgi:hypothetical protein
MIGRELPKRAHQARREPQSRFIAATRTISDKPNCEGLKRTETAPRQPCATSQRRMLLTTRKLFNKTGLPLARWLLCLGGGLRTARLFERSHGF